MGFFGWGMVWSIGDIWGFVVGIVDFVLGTLVVFLFLPMLVQHVCLNLGELCLLISTAGGIY